MIQFDMLRATFARGHTYPLPWRRAQLDGLERFLTEQETPLLEALKKDLGKSQAEAWTTELGFLLKDLQYTRKRMQRWLKPRKVATPVVAQPGSSKLVLEPLGTVLIMGAWNYPLQLTLSPVIAAIAAGNTVLLKPSEVSTHTAKVLAELLPPYLDEEAFAVVEGDADTAKALLALPFDHIFYTGGGAVGKSVMRAAAEHLTPVTLELGGKSPAIVTRHCDIRVSARRIAWGKWLNAGQTCIAPDYVLVEASVQTQLVEALQETITEFYSDDPQRSKDYGRIINKRHFDRLVGLLGEHTSFNESDYDRRSRYMAPILIDNPPADSAIMQEEIFGPLLPIISTASLDTAIDFVRQRDKPLACYAFTNSQQEQRQIERSVSCGNMCINDTLLFMLNEKLPFGGVGGSGMGRYHGEYGIRTFSHEKPVMTRSFRLDIPLRYPPFSKRKLAWLKKLL